MARLSQFRILTDLRAQGWRIIDSNGKSTFVLERTDDEGHIEQAVCRPSGHVVIYMHVGKAS